MIFTVAIAPIIALLAFFYINDRYDKEPLRVLARVFFGGILAVIPAMAVEYYAGLSIPAHSGWHFFTAGAVGLVEESCKWAILIYLIYGRPEFDEPYDGLIYGATASLGFAAAENVAYSLVLGLPTALVRACTAVPMHAICGAIMGRGLGRAKIVSAPPAKVPFGLAGLIAAILLHGCYDLFALRGGWLGLSLLVVTLLIGTFLTFRAMEELLRLSPFRSRAAGNP